MNVSRVGMASRALISQLLADNVFPSCGDHEGTAGDIRSVVSVLALALAVLDAHYPTEMREEGRRPSHMDL